MISLHFSIFHWAQSLILSKKLLTFVRYYRRDKSPEKWSHLQINQDFSFVKRMSAVIMGSVNCSLHACCSVIGLFSINHQQCHSCVGAMCQLGRKLAQRAAEAAERRGRPPTPRHAAAPSAAGQQWTRNDNAPLEPQAPHTAGKAPRPRLPPLRSRTVIHRY